MKKGNWKFRSARQINNSLLRASKHLLKQVYDHVGEGNEDYLREFYKERLVSRNLTAYDYHYISDTHIFWEKVRMRDEVVNILWKCDVNYVNEVRIGNMENPKKKIVLTDCSGYICALLMYVNMVDLVPTLNVSWKLGNRLRNTSATIDEPTIGVEVPVEQIEPGDVVGYTIGLTKHTTSDSHIMLVMAICEEEGHGKENDGDGSKAMFDKVLSVSSVGVANSRDIKNSYGLGIGYIGLKRHEDNPLLCYVFTKLENEKGYLGKIFRFWGEEEEQYTVHSSLHKRCFVGLMKKGIQYRSYRVEFPRCYKERKETVVPVWEEWWSLGKNDDLSILIDESKEEFSVGGKKGLFSFALFFKNGSFLSLLESLKRKLICEE